MSNRIWRGTVQIDDDWQAWLPPQDSDDSGGDDGDTERDDELDNELHDDDVDVDTEGTDDAEEVEVGAHNPWKDVDPFEGELPVRVRLVDDGSGYRFEFDSFEHFVRQAERESTTGNGSRDNASRSEERADSWDFGLGFDGAIQLGHRGWPEGARQVHAMIEEMGIRKRQAVPELAFSRVGPGVLDLNRLRQGHPMPWQVWVDGDRTRDTNQGGVVTVVVNACASAMMSADKYMQKGVVVCALVDLLERHNMRVELVMGIATTSYSKGITIRVLLKRPGDALNMDRVAFAIAHPACFRRLGLSVLEHSPKKYRDGVGIHSSSGYGRVLDMTEPNAIVISGSDYFAGGTAEQMQWLKKQLASQGIEWEPEP